MSKERKRLFTSPPMGLLLGSVSELSVMLSIIYEFMKGHSALIQWVLHFSGYPQMWPSKIVLHGVKHARRRQIKILSKGQTRLLYVDTSLEIMLWQEKVLWSTAVPARHAQNWPGMRNMSQESEKANKKL